MSFLLTCPYCGVREVTDFGFGGELTKRPTGTPDARELNAYNYFRRNVAGVQREWWFERAKERGVKLVGATAHYVTEELDAGPIIEQDVTRVSHRDDVETLIRKGADIERAVLARALRWHCEDRVLRRGNTTVVF